MMKQFCNISKTFICSSTFPFLFICRHLCDEPIYKYVLLEHLQGVQDCSREHKKGEKRGLYLHRICKCAWVPELTNIINIIGQCYRSINAKEIKAKERLVWTQYPCELGIISSHFTDDKGDYQRGQVAFENLTPELMFFPLCHRVRESQRWYSSWVSKSVLAWNQQRAGVSNRSSGGNEQAHEKPCLMGQRRVLSIKLSRTLGQKQKVLEAMQTRSWLSLWQIPEQSNCIFKWHFRKISLAGKDG